MRNRGTGELPQYYGDPAPLDEDALRYPGECVQCQDMTMLNAKGLCGRCRPMPACVEHPETTSVGKCQRCNRPHCDVCLAGRTCQSCAAKGPGKKRGASQEVGTSKKAPRVPGLKGMLADRKKVLGVLVAVLVVVQGGIFAMQYLNQGPPPTVEQQHAERLAVVRDVVVGFQQEKKRFPKDAAELEVFLKDQGYADLVVAGEKSPLPPNAVIYMPKGKKYDLYATTAEGTRFQSEDPTLKAPID